MTLTSKSGTDSNRTRNRSNSHAVCRALAETLRQAFWPRREWTWEMMAHFRVAITCRHGQGYAQATTRAAAKGRAGKLGKAIAGSGEQPLSTSHVVQLSLSRLHKTMLDKIVAQLGEC